MEVNPLDYQKDLWLQKSCGPSNGTSTNDLEAHRVPRLSCGIVCVICLAILIEHWLVIDGKMDRQKHVHST